MDFNGNGNGACAILGVKRDEYGEIMRVWEMSVRASHAFLQEEDILFYKKQIPATGLDNVRLFAVRDASRKILGFMGTSAEKIEMLFIIPHMRGKGIGRTFIDYAVKKLRVKKVDVNEQNENAVEFYRKMGFAVKARSELDMAGRPYPVLHLVAGKGLICEYNCAQC
ncbi:MAG: GNAT family N-acetyltransferase [Acidaminococcales bacterium]|jgi:putative acetyltransferase|nr:GNAT family N-acetyltransferase [Acidaminococcales bacterium]